MADRYIGSRAVANPDAGSLPFASIDPAAEIWVCYNTWDGSWRGKK